MSCRVAGNCSDHLFITRTVPKPVTNPHEENQQSSPSFWEKVKQFYERVKRQLLSLGLLLWGLIALTLIALGASDVFISRPKTAYALTVIGVLFGITEVSCLWWKFYATSKLERVLKACRDAAAWWTTEATPQMEQMSADCAKATCAAQGAEDAAWKVVQQYGVLRDLEGTGGREPRERVVMDRLAIPVGRHTARLLDNHPLRKNMAIELKASRGQVEDREYLFVKRRMLWSVSLEGHKPEIGVIIKPMFVFTSRVRLIDSIWRLRERGFIDVLWPVPHGWVGTETPVYPTTNKGSDWLEYDSLEFSAVDFPKLKIGPDLIKKTQFTDFDALLTFMEERLPGEEINWFVGETSDDEDKRELLSNCLGVWFVDDHHKKIGTDSSKADVEVAQRDTYTVWVRGEAPNQILYRYELHFCQPAHVKKIEFELEPDAQSIWELDPPSVHCPFEPDNRDSVYEQDKRQTLEWIRVRDQEEIPREGAPLLPGHGVAFSWREKAKTQERGDVTETANPEPS